MRSGGDCPTTLLSQEGVPRAAAQHRAACAHRHSRGRMDSNATGDGEAALPGQANARAPDPPEAILRETRPQKLGRAKFRGPKISERVPASSGKLVFGECFRRRARSESFCPGRNSLREFLPAKFGAAWFRVPRFSEIAAPAVAPNAQSRGGRKSRGGALAAIVPPPALDAQTHLTARSAFASGSEKKCPGKTRTAFSESLKPPMPLSATAASARGGVHKTTFYFLLDLSQSSHAAGPG